MKKGLLGSTALIGATALMAGAVSAAEAPTYKISGFMNFQVYVPSGDITGFTAGSDSIETTPTPAVAQDGAMYFGVDDAEIVFNVSGTADNGLTYGFKIEMNANTSDGSAADEARISLGGSWGTLLLGDEDGAEDTMNYGGETLLGAAGGWDGDGDDVMADFADPFFPTMYADTSDVTKVTYYSARFSGLQVGGSYAPSPNTGDALKVDDLYENWFGLGANYDNTFGDIRVRASVVYGQASAVTGNTLEDISAFSVGGIVGFQGFSLGANWTDNGESGSAAAANAEDTYWNVALGWESGPIYLSGGYMVHTREEGGIEGEATAWSVTADYSVAPGLGVYGEYTSYSMDDVNDNFGVTGNTANGQVDQGVFIAGVNVSF